MKVDGDTLFIKVDLSARLGKSSSGKSIQVATTGGNQPIGDKGIKVGVNVFLPNPDYVPS
jgi:hypothetical protein